jgi:hypothetical protein
VFTRILCQKKGMKLRALRPKSTFRRDNKYKPADLEVWHHIIDIPFPQIRESRCTTRVDRNSNSYQMLLPPFCSFHLNSPRLLSLQLKIFLHLSPLPSFINTPRSISNITQTSTLTPTILHFSSLRVTASLRDSTLPPWLLPMQTLGLPGVY